MIVPYIHWRHDDLLYIATSPAERQKLRNDGWVRLMGNEPTKWLGADYGAPGKHGLWRQIGGTWVHIGVTYQNVDALT